jgi:hypothetical protein
VEFSSGSENCELLKKFRGKKTLQRLLYHCRLSSSIDTKKEQTKYIIYLPSHVEVSRSCIQLSCIASTLCDGADRFVSQICVSIPDQVGRGIMATGSRPMMRLVEVNLKVIVVAQ